MNRPLLSLGVLLILLVSIGLIGIGFVLEPAKIHVEGEMNPMSPLTPTFTEPNTKQHITYAPSAVSLEGGLLRAKTWKEYPEYNIGFGVVAVLAFAGAGYVIYMMECVKAYQDEIDSEGIN